MTKEYNLGSLKAFSKNPFITDNLDKSFEKDLIDGFSKASKEIIKYLISSHSFTKEKFFFNVKEFNQLMGYINMPYPFEGIAQLCDKKVLARSTEKDLYWVNNQLFNTGVFKNHYLK